MELKSWGRNATGRMAGRTIVADVVRIRGRARLRVVRGDDLLIYEDAAVVLEPGVVVGLRDARLLDLRVRRATPAELAALRGAGYSLPRVK
jgi:hypothetical protein